MEDPFPLSLLKKKRKRGDYSSFGGRHPREKEQLLSPEKTGFIRKIGSLMAGDGKESGFLLILLWKGKGNGRTAKHAGILHASEEGRGGRSFYP